VPRERWRHRCRFHVDSHHSVETGLRSRIPEFCKEPEPGLKFRNRSWSYLRGSQVFQVLLKPTVKTPPFFLIRMQLLCSEHLLTSYCVEDPNWPQRCILQLIRANIRFGSGLTTVPELFLRPTVQYTQGDLRWTRTQSLKPVHGAGITYLATIFSESYSHKPGSVNLGFGFLVCKSKNIENLACFIS